MARNRRHQSAAIRFGPALKAFMLCLFIGGAGLGYVWQKNQIFDLSQRARKQEQQLQELKRRNKDRQDQLDVLRSPLWLETQVKKLNLDLAPARPEMVLRLEEPTDESSNRPPSVAWTRRGTVMARR